MDDLLFVRAITIVVKSEPLSIIGYYVVFSTCQRRKLRVTKHNYPLETLANTDTVVPLAFKSKGLFHVNKIWGGYA